MISPQTIPARKPLSKLLFQLNDLKFGMHAEKWTFVSHRPGLAQRDRSIKCTNWCENGSNMFNGNTKDSTVNLYSSMKVRWGCELSPQRHQTSKACIIAIIITWPNLVGIFKSNYCQTDKIHIHLFMHAIKWYRSKWQRSEPCVWSTYTQCERSTAMLSISTFFIARSVRLLSLHILTRWECTV